MDLDAPLRPDEVVKAPQPYTRTYPSQQKPGPLVPRPPTTFEPKPVIDEVIPTTKPVKEKKKKAGKKTTGVAKLKKKTLPESSASKSNLFNMDDWLEGNGNVPVEETTKNSKNSLSVEKPAKKSKKSTKKVREAYEETSGVCTPSIPQQSSPIDSETPEFTRLAANTAICVDFVARPNYDPLDHGRLTVHLRIKKLPSGEKIQKVELTMVDTMSAKVLRDSEEPILLADDLDSHATEATFDVQVTATNVSRMMRGTVTYFLVVS